MISVENLVEDIIVLVILLKAKNKSCESFEWHSGAYTKPIQIYSTVNIYVNVNHLTYLVNLCINYSK